MTGVGLTLFATLAAMAGLSALAIGFLRRVPRGIGDAGRGPTLRVLQRAPLGVRQSVSLLQVGSRVLVVAQGEQGARLLVELDGAERDDALRAAARPAIAAAEPVERFVRRWLTAARAGVLAGVLLGAAAAPVVAQPSAGAVAASRRSLPVNTTVPKPAPGVVATVPPRTSMTPGPIVVAPPPLPVVDIRVGEGKDQIRLSGAVGLVVFLGVLTLLPAMFLLMTSFTRILIVLHFLRSALGTQTTPPNQLLVALAVLLTGVVMHPVLARTNQDAVQPYFAGQLTQMQAYDKAIVPFREFMLDNTRDQDLNLFAELSGVTQVKSEAELPTVTIVSAFVTSELRTAFQMGFVIFLPFVVVDVIVASVLMSLGMFMLPPVMISMPLKLLLFVLADGWTLVVQNLAASFR